MPGVRQVTSDDHRLLMAVRGILAAPQARPMLGTDVNDDLSGKTS
jgi:hypothetical protein